MTKDELKDALIDALRESAALRAKLDRLHLLARFGAECLRAHRKDQQPDDLGVWWLQDKAIKLRLLQWQAKDAPCEGCEGCIRDEQGKYECLDYAPGVAGMVAEVTR